MHRRLPGQGRHGQAVLPPDELHDPPEDDGQTDGEEDQHQVALGAGGPHPQFLHHDGRQGHPDDRRGQGRGHGQADGEQGAVKHHAAQGDEVHLGEVDDAHGVVDHPETQGHQGIDRPSGQAGEDELDQVLASCPPRR